MMYFEVSVLRRFTEDLVLNKLYKFRMSYFAGLKLLMHLSDEIYSLHNHVYLNSLVLRRGGHMSAISR